MCINHSCKSNGYSLKNCEINPVKNDFKILSMVVKRRLSRSMYTRAVSYGFYTKAIWVNRGCRADFSVCLTVSNLGYLQLVKNLNPYDIPHTSLQSIYRTSVISKPEPVVKNCMPTSKLITVNSENYY